MALQHSECVNHSHTLTHSLCHISTLCPNPPASSFSPFRLPFLVCIPLYYSIHCICSSRYPGRNSAAARPCDQPAVATAALMCAVSYSSREKPCGDSLGDRLITVFHQSPLRPAPLQLEADRSPLFSIFYLTSVFPVPSNM